MAPQSRAFSYYAVLNACSTVLSVSGTQLYAHAQISTVVDRIFLDWTFRCEDGHRVRIKRSSPRISGGVPQEKFVIYPVRDRF